MNQDKAPIKTIVRNFYENITQFQIGQNQTLLSIGLRDPESYWYWNEIQEIGANN